MHFKFNIYIPCSNSFSFDLCLPGSIHLINSICYFEPFQVNALSDLYSCLQAHSDEIRFRQIDSEYYIEMRMKSIAK